MYQVDSNGKMQTQIIYTDDKVYYLNSRGEVLDSGRVEEDHSVETAIDIASA